MCDRLGWVVNDVLLIPPADFLQITHVGAGLEIRSRRIMLAVPFILWDENIMCSKSVMLEEFVEA